jgi:hypothetical protein
MILQVDRQGGFFMPRFWFALLAMVLVAVATSCAVRSRPPINADLAPQAYFDALEQRLLDAESLRVTFHITSEGAVESDLTGTLELPGNGVAKLSADGIFAGDPVSITLAADGITMTGGNNDRTFNQEQPPHLREALVIGLTRMGLLHNLAVMSAGAPPDRAGGGVREWVQINGAKDSDLNAALVDERVLNLPIHVSGNHVADAMLHCDIKSSLPTRRGQVVRFPGGTMTVVEEYEIFFGED